MRKSWVQLYAPFIVLAMVQALFIAVAPSRGPSRSTLASLGGAPGTPSFTGDAAGGGLDDSGGAFDGGTVGTVTGGSGGAAGGGTASGGPQAPSAGGGGGGAAAGDTSHCRNGHQVDILVNNAPPCVPKFSGDNGGATYQGVTKDTIKVVIFESTPNEQVNAILGAKGLAVSAADEAAFYKVAFDFINKHYELYGRRIEWKIVVGDCPTTPPDYDKCNAAAQKVVQEKPALVIWITSLYASVFDIWAKAGIPSIGGSAFDVSYYTGRRPYRYDVGMDGTQSARLIAEYYCKKMAGQKADHSGSLIHPQIGARGQVNRRLGIVVPEIEANVATAKEVAARVKACGGGDSPIFTYASDIERATQQTQATVAGLIANKVTTVTCMCDPIAPVFLTKGMTSNGYFPEFLLPGLGLLDYDLLGQLYDSQQMQHAFGPSQLAQPTTLDDGDPARVWRAMGRSGHPCGNNGCGLQWAWANMAGIFIQAAGPNYNPLTLERGVLSLPPSGGWAKTHNPKVNLYDFGQGDYTGLGDIREVYWSADATTPTDGSKGAYLATNGGQRWRLGELPANGLAGIPVARS